ncbi:2OG-Fe(II) oxygenase [Wenzhouxiangella sp. EGI_FJ10409]|uniref:2OG-Fe(II) oxygenase n=1 Tax=Wenzhouxiangella sp. EGI_FJ10409 TaxID=3243767 RepID=UPI0035E058F9
MSTNTPPGPDLERMTQAAEAGVAQAQFSLGLAWLYGDTGRPDPARAWDWLDRAQRQGVAEARAALGTMCLSGQCEGREGAFDLERAVELLESAHADDSVEAAYRLGTLKLTGCGVPADRQGGAGLIETAARRGHMLALNDAAWCLEHGLGLARNPARALKAWQLAAEAGMPRGWFTLGVWLAQGRHVSADPALARACLDKAARSDFPMAAELRDELADEGADAGRALGLQVDPAAAAQAPRTRREVLSEAPRIEVLHDFVPVDARAHLIARARPMIEPSRVLSDTGSVDRSRIRTSGETCLLPELLDVTAWHLLERLHEAMGIPMENGEPLIILQYTPGSEYQPHYDYFDPDRPGSQTALRQGGQRTWTLLTYLNAVAGGGATAFPDLDIEVAPDPGSVLAFRNVDEAGGIEPRTLHAGLPVTAGEKWLATRWIRERPFVAERGAGRPEPGSSTPE